MPNQTPHTPQNQTPSLTDGRTTLGMKAPIISPELYERFEQAKAIIFSEEAIEASNEALRKAELKNQQQNQQSEFIEINGICLETQNLGRPINKSIVILKKGDKIINGMPYCLNNGDDWHYNWHAAILESNYLGKRLPTDSELAQLFGSKDTRFLTEQDFKILTKKLNLKQAGGSGIDSTFRLWTSTEHDSISAYIRSLSWNNKGIFSDISDKSDNYFSVRCIIEPEEKIQKRDRPPF